MVHISYITEIAIIKAKQSGCRYRVAAVGISKLGDIIGCVSNKPRLAKEGGGLHAEVHLIRKYGKKIKSIFLCRVNSKGKLLPIVPCKSCKKLLKKLNIKVYSVGEIK